ncbi:hypothetical protein ACP70R_043244 [Stipagrostis hirtigluma subsp. patula]
MEGQQSQSSRNHSLESILQDQTARPCNLPLQYLKDATNDFSEERVLGRGSFGVVYKGVLQNGQVIAVKRLGLLPGVQDKQFENEVYHLMRLKHENIVRFVGYCFETQNIYVEHEGKNLFAEKQHRLLCLEFLPNGSLDKYVSDESCGLDWKTRYKIIVGICHGLHHLHEEWQNSTPIIHLDLKPSNILLDDNMVPKIADFGISRLFDPEQTRAHTTTLQGSLGYMAPEYLNKGIITIMTDMFSLGVIILEIITGHKNYPDGTETSTQEFVEYFWDSNILDGSKEESSPADKVDDHIWKKSDLTFDQGKAVQISREHKEHGNYFGLTEERKNSPKDTLRIEILEQAERRDPQPGESSIFLALAVDTLRARMLYFENRVAFARILFPVDARVATDIAQVDGTLEFILASTHNQLPGTQWRTVDTNDTTFEMKEDNLFRMKALSKTVELGKRFFPRCSEVLSKFMDDETELVFLGRDTSVVKRRFHELQDVLRKAFYEDKDEFDRYSYSSSTSIREV